jgi:predicted anti-sigma-YlaC factor YlaD
MHCHAAQRLLSAERDGALSSAERAVLDGHLVQCGECRQMRAALAGAAEYWRASTARVPIPDAERAWQDIARAIRTTTPATSKPAWGLPRWTLPLGAAAALVLAAMIAPNWKTASAPQTVAAMESARADFVEVGNDASSSVVYVDGESGWLVVWAVDDASTTRL